MSVIVFVDASSGKVNKGGFEAINYAKKIADSQSTSVTAIVAGSCANVAELGEYGANKVLHAASISATDAQVLAKAVVKAAEQESASVVVFSHDLVGRAVAPRVAARLEAGFVAGASSVPDASFVVRKAVFSGKAFADVEIKTDKKVLSLYPNTFQVEKLGGSAEVVAFAPEVGAPRVTVKEQKRKEGEISLPEAELVVSAGRGMKGPEHWGLIEELAKELGAATACSRPVADIGWRPHHEHVGQTGVAVAPNLYIAVGISGAIQHLAGVNRSKVIVVINKDPEAPFFKAADYGIVGDAFEVLPKLIDAVKKFKASAN
jgi:electron transfer flavoprotein alpha subunit